MRDLSTTIYDYLILETDVDIHKCHSLAEGLAHYLSEEKKIWDTWLKEQSKKT